ncbi:MAG: TIGR02757 family protein [Bacteroidota bacterium]
MAVFIAFQTDFLYFKQDKKLGILEQNQLHDLLESKYLQFNQPDFIPFDPISIPHQFILKQDIEIMGFWSAILAWGQRKTIINKCNELIQLMDGTPFDFIKNHSESDLKRFLNFKHRTFNAEDALYFILFFKEFYQKNESLEIAFIPNSYSENSIEVALINFRKIFFDSEFAPNRTKKHIASPITGSTCKRLNMFLRWMVRTDNQGVDFGIWKQISPSQLICPCDVHVERVSRQLGLIIRPQSDWKSALELTDNLKKFDRSDPVKYDFALFGMGVEGYLS